MITAITPTHSHIIPFTVFPAVSYTHLDVYKRQALLSVRFSFCMTNAPSAAPSNPFVPEIISKPVSYTHLDVYKRQGIYPTLEWMQSVLDANKENGFF